MNADLHQAGSLVPRPRQVGDEAWPVFDALLAKLRIPWARPGSVRRTSLIQRLAREESRPIVSVVAPAGYGKTTLLVQWAERSRQAVAWVSVDDQDNDPKVLLGAVATALDAVQPVAQPVFDALASPSSSVLDSVVPRLGNAFAAMTVPVLLILDDVHVLDNIECRAAVSVLAGHVPGSGRLVLAGRDQPPLRVARLRAEGRIAEIGPADLALTREEAALLVHDADVMLGEDDLAALHRRTEGWPAGLYLAALYLRESGSLPDAAASFGGSDPFVSEYLESELLAQISPGQRVFLSGAAVLERLCGPLCDAVLGLDGGSGEMLAELARSNLLLVPVDRQGQWYRYHRLFRDMLLADLDRREPGLVPVLRRRAAAWCLDNGLAEEALEYSIAAGDVQTAARLVEERWLQVLVQGRGATLRRWIGWLDDRGGVEEHPMVAVAATVISATLWPPAETERWARRVERWQSQDRAWPGDPVGRAWATLVRAELCRHGIEQMRADADQAARLFEAAHGVMVPLSALLQGIARVLGGDGDGGDAYLKDSVAAGEKAGGPHLVLALAERSLLALARGDWAGAEMLAGQARAALDRAGIDESAATSLVCAVQARTALHRGDDAAARQQAAGAQRMLPWVTYTLPYLAVQARLELARVYLALADLAGARTLMREIDDVLNRRPGLGTLAGDAEELRAQLAHARGSTAPGISALTTAELRLLPLLSTHLPMHEIAAQMYLSPHTIRTQGKSIYRKLGAATRSQAITRARDLGLLEG